MRDIPDQDPLSDQAEQELVNQMIDEISDYLFEDARDHVAQELSQAGDQVDETIAALSYQTITQMAHQVEQQEPRVIVPSVIFPVAAETIDFMIEIANAVGAPIANEQEVRERSMIELVQIHMAAVEDDPEQKAIAEEMLAEMMEDGTYDQGMEFVDQKIKEEGGDPAQARMQGEQMLAPQPDPVAAGVQQGLTDQYGGPQ